MIKENKQKKIKYELFSLREKPINYSPEEYGKFLMRNIPKENNVRYSNTTEEKSIEMNTYYSY